MAHLWHIVNVQFRYMLDHSVPVGALQSQDHYSAGGPDFQAAEIARLDPGEVLIDRPLTYQGSTDTARVSMTQFKQLACQ